DVRPAEVLTCITGTSFFDRTKITAVRIISNRQITVASDSHTMPGKARWPDTVEHINSPNYPLDEAIRRAHTHQIAGFFARHDRHQIFKNLIHELFRFPHAQSTNAVAREI